MTPEKDVMSLAGGSLDAAGVHRLREAFLNGSLAWELARKCEQAPQWVWMENPGHHAGMCAPEFQQGYDEFVRFIERARRGLTQPATKSLTLWSHRMRAVHREGQLSRTVYAILQSTDGWTWDGDFHVTRPSKNLESLESMMVESSIVRQLNDPEPVGLELLGRLFSAVRMGYRRARLQVYLDEYTRWVSTYPEVPVPSFLVSRGVKLGRWVSRMRRHAMLGLLDYDTYLLLDELPGWSWEFGFAQDALLR